MALSLTACNSDDTPAGGGSGCTPSDFQWATAGGGPGQGDAVTGVAQAADGSVWVTGTFIGATTWGTFALTANDTVHTSIFVAKLDPTGHVVLARAIQAAGGGVPNIDNQPTRIRLDAAGNPVIVGHFELSLDVDNVHLTEHDSGNGAAFVLGLDGATGTATYGAASSGDTDHVIANDVAIGTDGDLYVTGGYNGKVTLGTITVTSTSSEHGVFVGRFSPTTQAWVWAKGWSGMDDGTNDGGIGRAIAVNEDGRVYVTGNISGTLKVDTTVLDADGGAFIAKLGAPDGAVEWATQIAPTDPGDRDWPAAATVDSMGDLYITGQFSQTATFAGTTGAPQAVTTMDSGVNMFLAKYDLTGALVWLQHAGAPNGVVTRGDDVAFDGDTLYVGGFTQGDTTFQSTTLAESSPLFVAKYDTGGRLRWAQNATQLTNDSSSSETAAIAVTSPTSGVVIGGLFDTMTAFGDTALTGAGEGDAFVAQLCN